MVKFVSEPSVHRGLLFRPNHNSSNLNFGLTTHWRDLALSLLIEMALLQCNDKVANHVAVLPDLKICSHFGYFLVLNHFAIIILLQTLASYSSDDHYS